MISITSQYKIHKPLSNVTSLGSFHWVYKIASSGTRQCGQLKIWIVLFFFLLSKSIFIIKQRWPIVFCIISVSLCYYLSPFTIPHCPIFRFSNTRIELSTELSNHRLKNTKILLKRNCFSIIICLFLSTFTEICFLLNSVRLSSHTFTIPVWIYLLPSFSSFNYRLKKKRNVFCVVFGFHQTIGLEWWCK